MKILKFNNNTTIQIPEEEIGISCSGGTDSSLLLYILMKYHKEKIHIFTLSNNIKRRANAIIVPNVIEKCIQLTGNFNVIHHSWYSEDQTKEDLFNYPYQFIKNKHFKYYYHAVTANPPDGTVFQSGQGEHELRNPLIIKDEVTHDGYLFTPFVNKDKKVIASIYKELDLMDNLFPVTRSCEVAGKLEYYGHCGKCWWCEERQWGFDQL